MSLKKRLIALFLSVLMLGTLCGCDPMALLPSDYDITKLEQAFNGTEFSREDVLSFEDMKYSRPDFDEFEQLGGKIETLLDEHASRVDVVNALDDFYEAYIHYSTMTSLAGIRSDLDVNDEYYSEEYSYCGSIWGEVSRVFDDVMIACSNSHMSSFLDSNYFGGFLEDNYNVEGGYTPDDELVALQTRESELQSDYRKLLIKINASDSYDIYEECNEAVAEIYIELVKLRHDIAEKTGYNSYAEYAYDSFGREYEPDELEEYITAIKSELIPLYKELSAEGAFDGMYYDLSRTSEEKTMTTLSLAAKKMGGEIYEALMYMKSCGLYDISSREEKLDSSYVTYLDDKEVPYLFSKTYGYSDDVLTVGHEFGHFVDYYTTYCSDLSNDSAEMFSQGMEYLLLQYIDDEKLAQELTEFKLLDTLFLYVYQLSFNEFEERIYDLSDDELTVENINAIYGDIAEEYGYTEDEDKELMQYMWIDISHLFDQPFYIISYCVSDSAAFELYSMELSEPESGLEAYLSMVDSCDEYGFLELLENEGLNSPITADTIKGMAKTLKERIAA